MKKQSVTGLRARKLVLNPEVIADLTAIRAVAGGANAPHNEVSATGCGNSGTNKGCEQIELLD